ncbi:hypothetical protein HGP17_04155 [Rhizobium sp. P38BS-XIX]|uniref:hypothetical protein n=1 Tax=Rhizobium sp. P38BS-XIX TaxID=2726740 RepID=UPI0014573973|nr:hypothetical protein [Rhizobium sp. P38BS-XIX]NLR96019.1 hypothetical protein [Rhizobium sp. P38BS-XIX]
MANDQSDERGREKESNQPLAKIQHSRAHEPDHRADPDGESTLVADPRNRLVDGKVDPETKEREPKRE